MLKLPADNDRIHLPPGRRTPLRLQPESQYENHCRSIASRALDISTSYPANTWRS